MKKLIENVTARLSQILREMRLLVVWLGALGILFSCVAAEDSGGGAVSPVFSANDITATFGSDTGTARISGTNITITGLRNYDDSILDSSSMPLAFSIAIADGTVPEEFTVTTPLTTTSLTNGMVDLIGAGATDIDLGTFTITITADSTTVDYSVTVQFGGALELQVSGAVTLPSGSNYISIVEGAASMNIRGAGCPDTHVAPTFAVYEGTTLTTYTTAGFPASLSPYVDRTTPANNTKAVVLSIMDGADVVGTNTLNFNYIVSCEASDLAGGGTVTAPYQISSASGLDLMALLVDTSNATYGGSSYVLTTDIDLGVVGAPWAETPGGEGFQPIGASIAPSGSNAISFSGDLDCNGNKISNLFINRSTETGVALIAHSTGNISNCDLVAVNLTGMANVGGLVGWQSNGTIANSSVTGSATGVGATGVGNIGGLIGRVTHANITDSFASVTVMGTGSNVGGLTGSFPSGTIRDSYATGKVTGNKDVGGLVGSNEGKIINSYATGNVTTPTSGTNRGFAGGLLGQMTANGSVSNSYATGNVVGTSNIGGLIGYVSPAYTNTNNIANVYARGTVSGSTNEHGGLIGHIRGATRTVNITNSYAIGTGGHRSFIGQVDTDVTLTVTNSYALESTGGLLGFTPAPATDTSSEQTLANLKAPTAPGMAIYVDWNTNIWDFGRDSELPILKGLPNESSQTRD